VLVEYAGSSEVSRDGMEALIREVEMMTSLGRHDNVIRLIGCACSTDGEFSGLWTSETVRR